MPEGGPRKAQVKKTQNKRTGDDLGLVAELLEHAPEDYLRALLDVFRHALSTGHIPTPWQTTIFKTLPKSSCARFASDYRPIASLLVCVCWTKFLPTSCWVGWKKPSKIHKQKSNTVFENKGRSKNTC